MLVQRIQESPSQQEKPVVKRIHALDALRASIMIMGVFLHGAVGYMHDPMPGLVWPISAPSSGWGFDLVLWYIHGFRIPLFFLVSGFFASLLCSHKGPQYYLKQRLTRIAVPLSVAIVTILPIVYFLWGLGLMEQGRVTWTEVQRQSFANPQIHYGTFGLAHLWFLQYLLFYSLVYYFFRSGFPAGFRFPHRLRILEHRTWPVLLVAATFPMLWLHPTIYLEFQNRWFPQPWEFVYYGLYFIVGTLMYRVYDQLNRFVHLGPVLVIASLVVFAIQFPLIRDALSAVPARLENDWYFAFLTALYTWLAVWGFLGLCLKVLDRPSRRLRFLSDSAYWIYLVHLPLVIFIQLELEYLENHTGIEILPVVGYAITVSGTLVIALLSYRYLVRYRAIGKWLHGPKVRPVV